MKRKRSKGSRRATFLGTLGATLEGCDVSHCQSDIDWPSVGAAGKHFAYLKATEGSTVTDDHYSVNYMGAGEAGLVRGAYHFSAYHFFRHGQSGATQAAHFLEVAQPEPGDLPPALDVEDPPGDQSVAAYIAEMLAFVSSVKAAIGGQSPALYESPNLWSSTLKEPQGFESFPLWIAQYTTHDPTVPDRGARTHGGSTRRQAPSPGSMGMSIWTDSMARPMTSIGRFCGGGL